MSDEKILAFIRIGNEFAKIAEQAARLQVYTPSQLADLMIAANDHKRQMRRYYTELHDYMKERKIDFAIIAMIEAQMASPPFKSYCDWWSSLVEQFGVAPVLPETDPWILVELADCKFDRSTMLRHSRKAETTGVRKGNRGKYEIRRSCLAEYLDVRHRRKYGIE